MFINPRTITNNFLLKKANKASSIHTTYSCAKKKTTSTLNVIVYSKSPRWVRVDMMTALLKHQYLDVDKSYTPRLQVTLLFASFKVNTFWVTLFLIEGAHTTIYHSTPPVSLSLKLGELEKWNCFKLLRIVSPLFTKYVVFVAWIQRKTTALHN